MISTGEHRILFSNEHDLLHHVEAKSGCMHLVVAFNVHCKQAYMLGMLSITFDLHVVISVSHHRALLCGRGMVAASIIHIMVYIYGT